MPRSVIILLWGALATASLSDNVQATDVTILNAGFEEPELDDGTWITGGPGWEFGIYYADDRTAWIEGADGSATDGGIWNPDFEGGFTDGAYAGENGGWAFSQIDIDAGLSQILEDRLQANTQYHLQVQVGNPLYNQTDFTADYRIELLAGDILLAAETGESPVADSWELHSLTYNSGPSPAQGGEPLAIRLVAVEYDDCVDGGCEVDFDEVTLTASGDRALAAGDADQDYDFDQLDLVQVQVAAKYLTGQAATWGEGDWDGAPGGTAGTPPPGNGFFDQFDIIAALSAGTYLTGPYAAIRTNDQLDGGQSSVVYDAGTGEIATDAPVGVDLVYVPEPSTFGLLLFGMLFAVLGSRRR